jgi:4'-phosphopantetheinyl transferase
MLSSPPISLIQHDLQVDAAAPLAIDLPELTGDSVVCIGLSIDWAQQQVLYAAAQRHTLAEEHARAERFFRPQDRLRHLFGRMLLRRVATHYGGMDPARPIGSNHYGKPVPDCSVGCNLSHAGTQVWVAVSRHAAVGIDVESASAPRDFKLIAAGFHPQETAALHAQSDPAPATMRCWSRKEAIAKATGMGLSLPLQDYAVDCGTDPANWLHIAPPATSCPDWSTVDLPIGEGYVGALAVKGQCNTVTVLRLHAIAT